MKPTFPLIALILLIASCDTADNTLPPAAGEPVQFVISPIPGLKEASPGGASTRTSEDNIPVKTVWNDGDKLHIWMYCFDDGNSLVPFETIQATATYNATTATTATWQCSDNLRWPLNATKANFWVFYNGNRSLDDIANSHNYDILRAVAFDVPAKHAVCLNFKHAQCRIKFTNIPEDKEFSVKGEGFRSVKMDAGVNDLYYLPGHTTPYPIPKDDPVLYLGLSDAGSNSWQLCDGAGNALANLTFDLNNDLSTTTGYTYVVDVTQALSQTGGEHPGNEQEKRQKFFDWIADPTTPFTLETDINLAGMDWTPVNLEYVTFDGGGHTISGLKVESGGFEAGLFGFVGNAVIRNLHVSGTVDGGGHTGGIASFLNGSTLENVSFSGDVTGSMINGGIAGGIQDSHLFACRYLSGNVSGGSSRDIYGLAYGGNHVIGCHSHNDGEPNVVVLNTQIDQYNNSSAGESKRCNWQWYKNAEGVGVKAIEP